MPNEDSLLYELHKDHAAAWTAIYKHFRNDLLWYCIRLTNDKPVSEEIANDCIEKACQKREEFSDTEHVRRFLSRCAKNACFDHLRKTLPQRKLLEALRADMTELEEDAFNNAEVRRLERMQILLQAVAQLPQQQQKAFRLIFLFEMEYDEAAIKMGLKKQTVYNLMNKAVKNLKKRIGNLLFFDKTGRQEK